MTKKSILFITHHNNDFDHFLPLISNYVQNKDFAVKILAFYSKDEILKNKLHRHICRKNSIDLESMAEVCHLKTVNNLINKIHSYSLNSKESKKTKNLIEKIKRGIIGFLESPKNTILQYSKFVILRYHVICSIFMLNENKIKEYIKLNNINLLIIDQRSVDKSLISSNPFKGFINSYLRKIDPMNLVLFRVTNVARKCGIPIFMMPHGPQPISKGNLDKRNKWRIENQKNPFRPDHLILCSSKEINSLHYMKGLKSTSCLGDPRFDIEWINYLEACALKAYESTISKPAGKIVLLYLMDIFAYNVENNFCFKQEMNKDILSLVNYFPELEIWVKHHPRDVYKISLDFIDINRRENIKQFGNDTDTNILLAKADICLAASSTVLISPILQRKPVIFYSKWKNVLQNVTCIYDGMTFEASSKEQLIEMFELVKNNNYSIKDSFLQNFYNSVFSGDRLYENMLEKYIKKIDEILEKPM